MILFSCAAKYVVDGVITAEDEYDRKSIDVSSKQLTDVTKGSKSLSGDMLVEAIGNGCEGVHAECLIEDAEDTFRHEDEAAAQLLCDNSAIQRIAHGNNELLADAESPGISLRQQEMRSQSSIERHCKLEERAPKCAVNEDNNGHGTVFSWEGTSEDFGKVLRDLAHREICQVENRRIRRRLGESAKNLEHRLQQSRMRYGCVTEAEHIGLMDQIRGHLRESGEECGSYLQLMKERLRTRHNCVTEDEHEGGRILLAEGHLHESTEQHERRPQNMREYSKPIQNAAEDQRKQLRVHGTRCGRMKDGTATTRLLKNGLDISNDKISAISNESRGLHNGEVAHVSFDTSEMIIKKECMTDDRRDFMKYGTHTDRRTRKKIIRQETPEQREARRARYRRYQQERLLRETPYQRIKRLENLSRNYYRRKRMREQALRWHIENVREESTEEVNLRVEPHLDEDKQQLQEVRRGEGTPMVVNRVENPLMRNENTRSKTIFIEVARTSTTPTSRAHFRRRTGPEVLYEKSTRADFIRKIIERDARRSERKRLRLSLETPEQREKRLRQMREYIKKRRAQLKAQQMAEPMRRNDTESWQQSKGLDSGLLDRGESVRCETNEAMARSIIKLELER
uniref:ALMS motif domain-containing protein n=1 Tax=Ascaris lumbricoides TaxID=6252 RepID=A0A9J2PDX1_ASCLU